MTLQLFETSGIPPPIQFCIGVFMRFYKHPEQMTPGSVWKICGEDALEYLWYDFDSYYYHGALYGTTPW